MTKWCLNYEAETKLLPGCPWPSLIRQIIGSYFLSLSIENLKVLSYKYTVQLFAPRRLPSVSQILRYPSVSFNTVLQILAVIICQKTQAVIKTY
jgi:hypothetical protein